MGCRTQDGGLVLGILLTAKEEGKRRGAARQHLGLAPDAGGGGLGARFWQPVETRGVWVRVNRMLALFGTTGRWGTEGRREAL